MTFVDPDTGENFVYYTNSEGWKDVEHKFAKPKEVFRILFIGDSVTAGQVRLNDLYTNKVREFLLEQEVSNVEIISMGVGAWGTDQILEALKLEGLKYEPDLVIYQLNPNDLTDNLSPNTLTPQDNIRWNKPFRYEIQNNQLVRISISPPASSYRNTKVYMRSAIIYNLMQVTNWVNNHLEDSKDETGVDINWWDKFPINPVTPIRYYAGEQTPEMKDAWALLEKLILEMKHTVESNGARFIVFTTAGDEGYRQWNIDRGWMYSDAEGDFIQWEGKRYPVNWYLQLEMIEEITTQYDIPLIKPVRFYERYKNDAHPNAVGNFNMALDIVDYLLTEEEFLLNWVQH